MILRWQLPSISKETVKSLMKSVGHIMGRHVQDPKGGREGLAVYKYSKDAQYVKDHASLWSQDFRQIRGLVYDHEGKMVSRAFPKFFNLNEPLAKLEERNHEWSYYRKFMLEKFDGSLFQAFLWNGELRFLTNGASEEYEGYARELFEHKKLFGLPSDWQPEAGKTYIFEGVHPNGEGQSITYPAGLYHLATIDMSTLEMTIDLETYPGEVHEVSNFDFAIKLQSEATHEGYVMYMTDQTGNVRDVIKLKSPHYWTVRKAKLEAEGKLKGDDIYRHFYIDGTDSIRYNSASVQVLLEDMWDDWSAMNAHKLNVVTQMLDMDYQLAKSVVENNREAGRKVVATTMLASNPQLLGLAMALYEKRFDQVKHVLNGKLLTEILKEYDDEPTIGAASTKAEIN